MGWNGWNFAELHWNGLEGSGIGCDDLKSAGMG